MARPATGSPRWNAKLSTWEARITLANGERKPAVLQGIEPCSDGTPLAHGSAPECENCARARRVAKLVSDKSRVAGCVPEETGETWNEWHDRYVEAHERLGKQTREMTGAGRKWISKRIGTVAMTLIRRDQIVGVRDDLTRAVVAHDITAKRAMNIWSDLVSAPFSRAFTDDDPKYSAVRVGPALSNPALGIKPPVTKAELDEDARARQPIYPHEYAQLMACAEVPVEAKRVYALAVFLYARPQELFALRWTDVDWIAREVRVRRKLDVRSGEEKPGTKSDAGIREIPIHPHLMPLLVALHEEREADDARIMPLVGSARLLERFADQTRRHLKIARIKRTELIVGTEDLMPFDFRSWRTTGCTWLAMLGTDSYVIAQQAGHKSPDTTWGSYIKRGPDLRQRHGEPFPPLPAELLEHPDGFGLVSVSKPKQPQKDRPFSGEGGIRTSTENAADRRDEESEAITIVPHDSREIVDDASAPPIVASAAPETTFRHDEQRSEPERATADRRADYSESMRDPDDALRAAIKAAVDAGDLARASALLEILRAAPRTAPVLSIARPAKR